MAKTADKSSIKDNTRETEKTTLSVNFDLTRNTVHFVPSYDITRFSTVYRRQNIIRTSTKIRSMRQKNPFSLHTGDKCFLIGQNGLFIQ